MAQSLSLMSTIRHFWTFSAALLVLSCSLFLTPSYALKLQSQTNFQQPVFLPVDEAFIFSSQQQQNTLELLWQITPEHYLYRHQFRFEGKNVTVGEVTLPSGIAYQDKYFGDIEIFREGINIQLPLSNIQPNATLTITYQGCADAGLCYPPESKTVYLTAVHSTSAQNTSTTSLLSQTTTSLDTNNANDLASTLNNAPLWYTLGLFFLLGVGLAFTPCVLPMYPILSGIVLGSGERQSLKRAFGLSFIYVQGMALTYSLLGLVVAAAGAQFQAMLQHPAVLGGISLLFIGLALSMFGVFNLQLPQNMQNKLNQLSNQQQGGKVTSVFVMGLISGLVMSPCTTAPLTGALLFVAQQGDWFSGALTLYVLSLGMGTPLILVGLFGNQLLPKSGPWMDTIKALFGFVLLAVPVFLLERLLSSQITAWLWTVLALSFFAFLLHTGLGMTHSKRRSTVVVAILGLIGTGTWGAQQWLVQSNSTVASHPTLAFQTVSTVAELNAAIASAAANQQPVMVDLYADWCVACKEFDEITFTDNNVQARLASFQLIRVDMSQNTPEDFAILKAFHVLGLPTLMLFNAQGEELQANRISGFLPPDAFINHLNKLAI